MKIVVDSREQAPLDFTPYPCTVGMGTLDTGDYSVVGLEHLAAIERKSISDLVASVTRERPRFERELARARGLDLFAVVVEGTLEDVRSHNYRSQAKPHAVLQSITAFTVRYGVNWIWASNPAGAAYFTFWTLEKYLAEAQKRFRMILEAEADTVVKTGQEAT
ncbi:MAG: ERCC4 domain-containing protein [Pseudodesulfovibrio sp.]|uniref:ERCC4 domain-containing protein n=1 Tax=Pseudodesulfovibrio sp. TaxID=2035812 RepID=UPI003D14507E